MNQNEEAVFEEKLKSKTKFVTLFYASWCPFSRRFLPIYQKCAVNIPFPCLSLMVDDQEDLCDKYDIDVYPTVLLFENGEVANRLDGKPGEGLSEKQLRKMLSSQ